jgi:hypothetical protein
MTIPLTASGGLFTREGVILGYVNAANLFRGITVTGHTQEIQQQFTETDQDIIDSLYSNELSYQNSCGSIMSSLNTMASNIIVQMVNDDFVQPNNALATCMDYLLNQMSETNQTVKACTVSISSSASAGNVGNLIVTTTVRTTSGRFAENSFAETIIGTVSSDAQSGTARAGSESIRFLGQQAINDRLSWLYPLGSGSAITVVAVNATIQGGGGTSNWLLNGNFETWAVANTPSSWNIIVGTAGSTIFKSTGQFYDGVASLNFLGNGSELTSINTAFTTYQYTGNIQTSILPLNQYAFSAFIKVDSTPAAGVLRFALTDQSNNVISDNFTNPNSVSVNLTTVSTTWINVNGIFRTPTVLPTRVNFAIGLTTALTSSNNVYIDHVAFTQMYQYYQGGPYVAVFSANTNSIIGDQYTVTVSNDYGGGFQRGFDKLFNMKSLGRLLPSATGAIVPTIPDSLII